VQVAPASSLHGAPQNRSSSAMSSIEARSAVDASLQPRRASCTAWGAQAAQPGIPDPRCAALK
jgi:hypothetical protein